MSKEMMRTVTISFSNSCYFLLCTYILPVPPVLPGLPVLSKSDMGDLIFQYWKVLGTLAKTLFFAINTR